MALQFTRQQLVGGVSYQPKTRIGNWNEDIELKEWSIAENLHKKGRGALLSTKMAAIYQRSMAFADSPDSNVSRPFLCYGDQVCFESETGTGQLSVYISDAGNDWAVSTCETPAPRVRNIFRILPVDGRIYSREYGRPVKLNDGFVIASSENIQIDETGQMGPIRYLACHQKGFEQLSRLSGESPIFMTTELSSKSVWKFESSLPGEYGFLETSSRKEVEFGAPFVIRHKMTNISLTTDEKFNFQGKISGEKECEVFGSLIGRKLQPAQVWRMSTYQPGTRPRDDSIQG